MPSSRSGRIVFHIAAIASGLISAFFVFYTIRLLYVTRFLTAIHAGGQGAYIGAITFPVLALVFGFISWRVARAAWKKNGIHNNIKNA